MLTVHHTVAFLVLAATWGAAIVAGVAYYRRREPRGIVTHLIALAQTLLVAQVGIGLLLLSEHKRAPERLHYLYGSLALLAALSPWLYAPAERRRAAGLVRRGYPGGRSARRAGVHDRDMSFFSRMNPTLRGFLIIVAIVARDRRPPAGGDAGGAADPRADRVPARDRVLRLPDVARAAGGHRAVADARPRRLLRRRAARRRRPRRRLVRRRARARDPRVRRRAGALRVRHVAHLARPAHVRSARARPTRRDAPSSAASASRIVTCWPTKIGVSRSV